VVEDDSTEGYGGVPHEWLPDLGRIAVASGRIEFAAYQTAVTLDLRQPKHGRSPNFSAQCEDIRRRLADPWRPSWLVAASQWSDAVSAWTQEATTAMNEHRNAILHRPYFHQKTDDAWVLKTMTRLDDFESADRLLMPRSRRPWNAFGQSSTEGSVSGSRACGRCLQGSAGARQGRGDRSSLVATSPGERAPAAPSRHVGPCAGHPRPSGLR
jgi:hypothetical protein